MKISLAFFTTSRFSTHPARWSFLLGALALSACATPSSSSSSASSTPAASSVATAPAPATPAPVVTAPAPLMAAPAPISTTPAPVSISASIDFDKQVKPFFTDYCIRCHSAAPGHRPSGGYDFTNEAGLKRGAGDGAESPIYTQLTGTGRNHMPPQGQDQPEADEIAMIKQWIGEGGNITAGYTAAPAQ